MTLACAWDETRWSYDYVDGIGQIKPIWHKELKKHNINPNSLQAIEYILVKKGLKHYKCTITNYTSYNRTMKAYKEIK